LLGGMFLSPSWGLCLAGGFLSLALDYLERQGYKAPLKIWLDHLLFRMAVLFFAFLLLACLLLLPPF